LKRKRRKRKKALSAKSRRQIYVTIYISGAALVGMIALSFHCQTFTNLTSAGASPIIMLLLAGGIAGYSVYGIARKTPPGPESGYPDRALLSLGFIALLTGITITFFMFYFQFRFKEKILPDVIGFWSPLAFQPAVFGIYAVILAFLGEHCVRGAHKAYHPRRAFEMPERFMLVLLMEPLFRFFATVMYHVMMITTIRVYPFSVRSGVLYFGGVEGREPWDLFFDRWWFWPYASIGVSSILIILFFISSFSCRPKRTGERGFPSNPPRQWASMVLVLSFFFAVVHYGRSLVFRPFHDWITVEDFGLMLAETSWIFGFGFLAASIAFAGGEVVGRTMKFAQSRIPPRTWTPFRSLRISTGLLIGVPIVLFVVFIVHSQAAFVRPEDNAKAEIHLPILRYGYQDHNPYKHSIFVAMDSEGEIVFQIRKGAVTEGGEASDVVSWMNENTPKERIYAIRFAADRRTPFVDLLDIVNRLPSDRIVHLGILGTNDGMGGDYLDILKECRYPPKPGEEGPKIDVRLFVKSTGGEGVYDLHHREPGEGDESPFTQVLKAEKDIKNVMKAMKKCFGDSQRNVLVELDETADVGSVMRAWEILNKLNAVYFRTGQRKTGQK